MNLEENSEYWSETFKNKNWTGSEISSIEFDGCTFDKCDFSNMTFKACTFADCEFIGCNLSNVKMAYSKISDVTFRDSKLIGINWTRVAWPRLIFSSPIKFYSSILNDSSFHGLSLQDLILEGCKAHYVDFRDGDFSQANFAHTDLSGSMFANSNLSGADFSEASEYDINIYNNNIKNAKFNRFDAVRLLDCLDIELLD